MTTTHTNTIRGNHVTAATASTTTPARDETLPTEPAWDRVTGPTTFEEVLPATTSSQHNGIRYTPGGARSGYLLIDTDRSRSAYLVDEVPTRWRGRAFRFRCLGGGSDKDATGYDVFLSLDPAQPHLCDCKGYQRYHRCKHTSATEAIVNNGWIGADAVNPDTDASTTEPPF